jgi:UDP-4-amino-4,6-dideoxy-N-acetyl-beta-L-altrosamine N-acetyltransferase
MNDFNKEDKNSMVMALRGDIELVEGIRLVNYLNLSDDESSMALGWRNDEGVRKYMLNQYEISLKAHLGFIESLRHRDDKYYWLFMKGEDYLGAVNIYNVNFQDRHCWWGDFAKPEMITTGVGMLIEYFAVKLVLELMGFHCLRCETIEDNKPALRTHEFFGFKVEGTYRDYLWDPEREAYRNVFVTSLLADEWRKSKTDVERIVSRLI